MESIALKRLGQDGNNENPQYMFAKRLSEIPSADRKMFRSFERVSFPTLGLANLSLECAIRISLERGSSDRKDIPQIQSNLIRHYNHF